MRLSVVTDGISQDLTAALSLIAEFGIREAELQSVWGQNVVEADETSLRRISAELERFEMKVPCIDSFLFKSDFEARPDPGVVRRGDRLPDELMQTLLRAIDVCRRFEAPYLRVFSFLKRGRKTTELEDRIADALLRASEIAGRADICLLIENDPGCQLSTGKETARTIEKIGSPSLKMLWNPSNALRAGEQPFPSGFSAAQSHIAHIHVNDLDVMDDGRIQSVAFGTGSIIDFQQQFKALRAGSVPAVVSLALETHGTAGNTEEASRQSIAHLLRLAAAA